MQAQQNMKLSKKQALKVVWTFSALGFLLSVLFTELIDANNEDFEFSIVYNFSNCTTEAFEQEKQCELACISENKYLYEWHWIYYIETPSENTTIYDGVNIVDVVENATGYSQITLQLSNYNAGYYRCWFHFVYYSPPFNRYTEYDFKIDQTEAGDFLQCNTSDQCLSLDASCENSTCICQYPFDYPYDMPNYTLACLKGVGPFRPCDIDQQCSLAGDNYLCIDGICDCNPNSTYIYVGEVNQYLCLLPVPVGDLCEYSEECGLAMENTWCYNNICGCVDSYYYNDTMGYCINGTIIIPYDDSDKSDLTFGEVVGIVVGTVAVIAIVFAIIGYCIARR